jgi:hypothetical protein
MEWALSMDKNPLSDRHREDMAEKGLRDLTTDEMALVSGGFPIVAAIVAAAVYIVNHYGKDIAMGVAGNATYDLVKPAPKPAPKK